jgi:hypothetical protein
LTGLLKKKTNEQSINDEVTAGILGKCRQQHREEKKSSYLLREI